MKIAGKLAKYIWALACVVVLVGCDRDDKDTEPTKERPGKITGIGDAPGSPQGSALELPKGIKITNITAHEPWANPGSCKLDGTGSNVVITLTLVNESADAPKEVIFPAGFIMLSTTDKYQHGILLDKVVVVVPPKQPDGSGGTCTVTLLLDCLNASRSSSDEEAIYTLGVVTNSPLLQDFIKKLSGKKTLLSQYNTVGEDFHDYEDIIQNALWSITDGDGLTEEDLENIESIPNK